MGYGIAFRHRRARGSALSASIDSSIVAPAREHMFLWLCIRAEIYAYRSRQPPRALSVIALPVVTRRTHRLKVLIGQAQVRMRGDVLDVIDDGCRHVASHCKARSAQWLSSEMQQPQAPPITIVAALLARATRARCRLRRAALGYHLDRARTYRHTGLTVVRSSRICCGVSIDGSCGCSD